MLIEVGGFFSYLMLIVLWIMTTIIRPEAFAENTVNVFGFPDLFVLAHYKYIRLY